MAMTTDEQIEAMTVIGNIQAMQRKIGVQQISPEAITLYTLEELREKQNSLITHYNEAVRNRQGKS